MTLIETLGAPVRVPRSATHFAEPSGASPYLFSAEEAVYCVRHDRRLMFSRSCDTDCDSVATTPVRCAGLAS